VGHTLFYPIQISKDLEDIYYNEDKNLSWIIDPLKKAISKPNSDPIKVDIKKYSDKENVVFINCLDYLYGHVLLKLLNAQYYIEQRPDLGVILILPKSFEWLAPKGTSEVWLVDISLSQAREWYTKLDNLYQTEIKKYKNAYISLAFSSPDPSLIKIEDFTKVNRFSIDEFDTRNPVITYIYRKDRLWLPGNFLNAISLAANHFKIKPLMAILLLLQHFRIKKLFRKLKRLLPEAKINIVGLGCDGRMQNYINDLRKTSLTAEQETEWCRTYADSHLVIGMHGSNMLLPSAHAAGFIEMLPSERYGNILQDVLLPYTDRKSHFLGRFVSPDASAASIAKLAHSVITKYKDFKKSMTADFLTHGTHSDLTRWQ